MDEESTQKIFNELLPYIEEVEAQSAAILQFLQEKGIASAKDLAPHLERAAKASSVRWSAVRARMNYLLTPPVKPLESPKPAEKDASKASSETEEAESKPSNEHANASDHKKKDDKEKKGEHVEQDAQAARKSEPHPEDKKETAPPPEVDQAPQQNPSKNTQPNTESRPREHIPQKRSA